MAGTGPDHTVPGFRIGRMGAYYSFMLLRRQQRFTTNADDQIWFHGYFPKRSKDPAATYLQAFKGMHGVRKGDN